MRHIQFSVGQWHARPLTPGDAPTIQAFFDANPLYFETINGQPASPTTAQEELDERPPVEMPFTEVFWLGFTDASGALRGVANIVSDLLAPGVWHTGLFIVATSLHGQGAAQAMYVALEAWMAGSGAQWLRLGVVRGNARAEAFWLRQGYTEVRERHNVDTGGRLNTIRVMVKPLLAGARFADYLAGVPRDRPEPEPG